MYNDGNTGDAYCLFLVLEVIKREGFIVGGVCTASSCRTHFTKSFNKRHRFIEMQNPIPNSF